MYDSSARLSRQPCQKFTGKERDAETGLDYFGARYYGSALGRFTSPDEVFWGQHKEDPQSWNLYSYAGNNPLRYTDPDGHDDRVGVDDGNGPQNCRTLNDDQYQSLYNQQNGQQGIGLPGGPSGGDITCGGSVCGSVSYHENSLQDESASIGIGILGGKLAEAALTKVGGWVAGLFGRTASNAVELNPGSILFSQRSVNGVEDIAASMRANGWSGPPVDVVRLENGSLVTLDNTRVLAASQTGTNVQAVVHGASDALPPSQIQRFTTSGGAPSTGGDAARLRIQNQGASFSSKYPNGSPFTGAK
jgi:RHS repeat-associated protein